MLSAPIPSKYLKGIDFIHSEMPKGIPAGATNSDLFAIASWLYDTQLAKRLITFRKQQAEAIAAIQQPSLN